MTQLRISDSSQLDENLLRHMVLNSIRSYVKKFKNEYGELVICADAGNVWRKETFPYYKANRAKNKEESPLDWVSIFRSLNKIREELKEFFPYRTLHIDRCEADDIIGTLANKFGNTEKVLVLSGDHDFIQLQENLHVKQYNPVHDKWITHNRPDLYLKEHIIRGDTGDGIPNVLSADNCLVLKIRQKSIMQKKLDIWLKQKPEEFLDSDQLRYYERNRLMVDLSNVPVDLQDLIYNEYDQQANKDRKNLMSYFMEHRLKNLLENITDF